MNQLTLIRDAVAAVSGPGFIFFVLGVGLLLISALKASGWSRDSYSFTADGTNPVAAFLAGAAGIIMLVAAFNPQVASVVQKQVQLNTQQGAN